MISKKHRFHGYGSLRYTYSKGSTVRGPLCAIKYTLSNKRNSYRLAVVVSKKVNKSAVTRNKIRRRLYEAVRLIEDQIKEPYDIIITVYHERIAEIEYEEIKRLVRAQFKQAGII